MNSAVGRVTPDEGFEFFVASDSGIYVINDLIACYASLIGPKDALNLIRQYSFGFREAPGLNYYCSVGNSGKVIWSPDDGNSWEDHSISGLTENLYGLDFLYLGSAGIGTVVCGQKGTMYVSTYSGSGWKWTNVNTNTTANLNSIAAIGKSLFIVVGDSGTILKTYDQGNSWEDHTVGGAKFNSIFDGGKVDAYGYLWIAGDNGRIYATTSYGISWFPQNSGVTDNLHDIQFRNQNEGMVVGDNGVVRYTNNGGLTWLADPYFNGITSGDIVSVATVDFNTGLALVRNTSLDGGPPASMFVVSSEPLSNNEHENTTPYEYSLGQNYPNPFNPLTKINYTVPQFGLIIIKVYDVLGKEVATLVNEEKPAGVYEVEFDASQMNSGIYFYKLATGNFSETKKLVFLK